MNRTDGPDPAAFPLGSPESRAAARLRAEAIRPLTSVVHDDDDGNPIWDLEAIYGPRLNILPADMTREEWLEAYSLPETATAAERDEILATRRLRWKRATDNTSAWRRAYEELVVEYHGRVPGSVAAARIPRSSAHEAGAPRTGKGSEGWCALPKAEPSEEP
jgi:hypothetical protein